MTGADLNKYKRGYCIYFTLQIFSKIHWRNKYPQVKHNFNLIFFFHTDLPFIPIQQIINVYNIYLCTSSYLAAYLWAWESRTFDCTRVLNFYKCTFRFEIAGQAYIIELDDSLETHIPHHLKTFYTILNWDEVVHKHSSFSCALLLPSVFTDDENGILLKCLQSFTNTKNSTIYYSVTLNNFNNFYICLIKHLKHHLHQYYAFDTWFKHLRLEYLSSINSNSNS